MAKKKYDFSGWATVNDMLCADGRTIKHGAFKECDGKIVPLVWNHDHDSPTSVLGHALLENRDEGVYAYCSLNDSDAGEDAKILVKHGDVSSLSIYANHLKQIGGDVYHGDIKEVSLVLAGANPGALIENIDLMHSENGDNEEARIYTDEAILIHSDDDAEYDDDDAEYDDAEYDDAEYDDTDADADYDDADGEYDDAEYDDAEYDDNAEYDDDADIAHADSEEDNGTDDDMTIGEIFDLLTGYSIGLFIDLNW